MLERVGGELVQRERKELHSLVRKRYRRAVNDNALSAWRDADSGQFRLHKLAEGDGAVIAGVTRVPARAKAPAADY